MNKVDFMKFFRDNDSLNNLTSDERIEIFSTILLGSSDITKELLNNILSDYAVDTLKVIEQDDNSIKISWHIDDLKCLAEDRAIDVSSLNDEDFREILRIAKSQHDANSGINWDVLEVHLEWYIEDKNGL